LHECWLCPLGENRATGGPGLGNVMAELISTGATSTAIAPFHIR
jgi:hypothetical protein